MNQPHTSPKTPLQPMAAFVDACPPRDPIREREVDEGKDLVPSESPNEAPIQPPSQPRLLRNRPR